jgi:Sortilin, neurotensin receptor 3, C-terminal
MFVLLPLVGLSLTLVCQTLYHRRVRNATCVVGNQPKAASRVVNNCACTKSDFEWYVNRRSERRSTINIYGISEFNHIRNSNNECVLVPGTKPLPDDDSCKNGEAYWYERTAYRLIPYSSCVDGVRPDRGTPHACPGFGGHSIFFWLFFILIPFAFTGLVAYYYYRRSGMARGSVLPVSFLHLIMIKIYLHRSIRLPGDTRVPYRDDDSGVMATLASVPWFVIGITGIAWEWVLSQLDNAGLRSRRGYRDLPVDEDAQILRFEDEA